MNRKIFCLAMGLVFSATWASVAVAEVESQAIEERKVENGKESLDPARGYVFAHAPQRISVLLLKEPNDEELTEYQAEWREKFEKAKKKYPRLLKRWRNSIELSKTDPRVRVDEKPVEPTEENFSIGQLERRMLVSFGPKNVYSKGDDYYSYLHEMEPGTYIYYGPVTVLPNGSAGGVCFCMGSVKFTVERGKIANLGDFLSLHWVTNEQARFSTINAVGSPQPRPVDYTLPTKLSAFPNAAAGWRAAGKMNNLFGILIGRMPPVPGVLGYERDTVIDLKRLATAEEAAVSGETENTGQAVEQEPAIQPLEQPAVEAAESF